MKAIPTLSPELQRVRFRFDVANHDYVDLATGDVLPHITGMLERTGWIDDTWFTEESSERGSAVHRLTADYDLQAIDDPHSVVSKYKGYLAAHVAAMTILQPTILAVEVPLVHPHYRFGGRPDRDVVIRGVRGPLELKSGVEAKSHRIQTALHAILISVECRIPPEHLERNCLYLQPGGKFKVRSHTDRDNRKDFDEARRIIRVCCT